MKLSDKQLGYITIFSIIGLILITATAMAIKDMKASHKILVEFDNIGSLQIQDPVTFKGFEVGQVIDTYWENGKSIIEIKFFEPVSLHENLIIKNVNFSMMGGRKVEIIDDKTQKLLDLNEKHVFKGYFEPGISETMHLILNVRNQLSYYKDLLLALKNGTPASDSATAKPGFTTAFWNLLDKSENTLVQGSDGIVKMNTQMRRIFKMLDTLSADIDYTINATDTTLKTIYSKSSIGIKNLDQQVVKLNQTLNNLNIFLTSIENDALYQELMDKKNIIDNIDSLALVLKTFVDFAANDGMRLTDSSGNKVPLVTLKNLKLFKRQTSTKIKQN